MIAASFPIGPIAYTILAVVLALATGVIIFRNFKRNGQIRFSIWQLIIYTTVVALIVCYCSYFVRILELPYQQ